MGIRKKYDSNFIFTFAIRSDTGALQQQIFLNMERNQCTKVADICCDIF